MDFNLKQEQFEIIENAINEFYSNEKGLFNFLREKGQVIDLKDEIYIPDFRYSRDLENGEIGIKALPFHRSGIKICSVALIKMILKIDYRIFNRWEKNGRHGLILHDLRIHNDVKRFIDQIEQFFLRGIDTKNEFSVSDVSKDEIFNCFFHRHDKRGSITLNDFRKLHEAIVNLKLDLQNANYNNPPTLMSDSVTFKWAESKYFQTIDGIESYKDKVIKMNNISKWINLHGNADNSKGDDYNLVCIANKELFNSLIKIIEKSSLNIINIYGGIALYWCGALEVTDNAIQIVKIDLV